MDGTLLQLGGMNQGRGRPPNQVRIVLLLLENPEGLPNHQIKKRLDLSDETYQKEKDRLIWDGVVEKYRCYGGGIRLTRRALELADDTETLEEEHLMKLAHIDLVSSLGMGHVALRHGNALHHLRAGSRAPHDGNRPAATVIIFGCTRSTAPTMITS